MVSIPTEFNPSLIAWILSVSLNLSSSIPSIVVFPLALTAAIDRIGNSSIIEATLDFGILIPFKILYFAEISAIGSPFISRLFENEIFAPISVRLLYKPILKSLTHTFKILISLFGVMIEATTGNAALEGSEGISMSCGLRIGKPSRVIFQDESGNCIVEIFAPKYFNILSL